MARIVFFWHLLAYFDPVFFSGPIMAAMKALA
jgi:hypothetical protein